MQSPEQLRDRLTQLGALNEKLKLENNSLRNDLKKLRKRDEKLRTIQNLTQANSRLRDQLTKSESRVKEYQTFTRDILKIIKKYFPDSTQFNKLTSLVSQKFGDEALNEDQQPRDIIIKEWDISNA